LLADYQKKHYQWVSGFVTRLVINSVTVETTAGNKKTTFQRTMLWIFQVLALSAGLYGCQVWATNSLKFISSTKTIAHIHHAGFLKMLLGVNEAQTHIAY